VLGNFAVGVLDESKVGVGDEQAGKFTSRLVVGRVRLIG
jgi:hypothetical protein